MAQKKIWMRLGVDVTADEETINKLLNGDDNSVLAELVKNGQFELVGESYIPANMVEEYNEENGTNFEEEERSFYY